MRDVEKGFGRNTANVKASSSETSSFFDANGIKSELSALDGSDVS